MSELTPATLDDSLHSTQPIPLDQHPAAVFLAGLSTTTSRQTMRQALDGIAGLLGAEDCLGVQWQLIRFQHVNAIKAALNEQYQPATVNKLKIRLAFSGSWRKASNSSRVTSLCCTSM